MTAYEIFERCAAAQRDTERLTEKLERRRALATGCTSKPMTKDGGGHGSDDASMRLLDYMTDVESIESELRDRKKQRDQDLMCASYIADFLPPVAGNIMSLIYMEGIQMREVAARIGYSISHTKRLRKEAEEMCQQIIVTWWDGIHIPTLVVDTDRSEIALPMEKMSRYEP